MLMNFNAFEVGVSDQEYPAPPPRAWYEVKIIKETVKEDKTRITFFLRVERALDSTFKLWEGKEIAVGLNVGNANSDASRIAQEKLSMIALSTVARAIGNTEELHNISFYADLGPQTKNPTYTELFGTRSMNGKTPREILAGMQVPSASAPALPVNINAKQWGGQVAPNPTTQPYVPPAAMSTASASPSKLPWER